MKRQGLVRVAFICLLLASFVCEGQESPEGTEPVDPSLLQGSELVLPKHGFAVTAPGDDWTWYRVHPPDESPAGGSFTCRHEETGKALLFMFVDDPPRRLTIEFAKEFIAGDSEWYLQRGFEIAGSSVTAYQGKENALRAITRLRQVSGEDLYNIVYFIPGRTLLIALGRSSSESFPALLAVVESVRSVDPQSESRRPVQGSTPSGFAYLVGGFLFFSSVAAVGTILGMKLSRSVPPAVTQGCGVLLLLCGLGACAAVVARSGGSRAAGFSLTLIGLLWVWAGGRRARELKAAATDAGAPHSALARTGPVLESNWIGFSGHGGASAGQHYRIVQTSSMVGREAADFVVPEPTVSARHARLDIDESGRCILHDLDSTNGTYINGNQISSAEIREGDTVVFGDSKFRFINRPTRNSVEDEGCIAGTTTVSVKKGGVSSAINTQAAHDGMEGKTTKQGSGLWHFATAGRDCGPAREQDIHRLIQEGTIGPSTLVWQAGMSDWAEARLTPLYDRFQDSPGTSRSVPIGARL